MVWTSVRFSQGRGRFVLEKQIMYLNLCSVRIMFSHFCFLSGGYFLAIILGSLCGDEHVK